MHIISQIPPRDPPGKIFIQERSERTPESEAVILLISVAVARV